MKRLCPQAYARRRRSSKRSASLANPLRFDQSNPCSETGLLWRKNGLRRDAQYCSFKRANGWRAAKVSWLRSATLRQDAVRGGPEAPPYPRPMRAPRDLSRCVPSSARPARSGFPGTAARPARRGRRRAGLTRRLASFRPCVRLSGFPTPRESFALLNAPAGRGGRRPRARPHQAMRGPAGKGTRTEAERPRRTGSVAFQGKHWPAVSGSGDDSASILGSQAGFLAPAPQGVSHGSWVQHRGARPEVHKNVKCL